MSDSSDDFADLPINIKRLNDENYYIWKSRVQSYLSIRNVWKTITQAPPKELQTDIFIQKDLKAQRLIQLLIDDNQTWIIENAKSAKEMWDSLKIYHEKPSLTKTTILWKELRQLELEENGDMWDHVGDLRMIFWRLKTIGQEIPEKLKVAILMESLPRSYDEFLMYMRVGADKELEFDHVEGKLRWEYRRREDSAEMRNECTFCGRQGHVRKACFKFLRTQGKKNDD